MQINCKTLAVDVMLCLIFPFENHNDVGQHNNSGETKRKQICGLCLKSSRDVSLDRNAYYLRGIALKIEHHKDSNCFLYLFVLLECLLIYTHMQKLTESRMAVRTVELRPRSQCLSNSWNVA